MTREEQARNLLERIGIDNAQELSAGDVAELANMIAERDAYKFAAEQAIGMGTAKAIMEERDQLKHRVRELEEQLMRCVGIISHMRDADVMQAENEYDRRRT